jgi:hypothetical protein
VDRSIGGAYTPARACRPNAAHAGFEGSVAAKLALGGKTSLAIHVEAVVNGLRNGKRLKDAVAWANTHWPPQRFPLQEPAAELPMQIRGDDWSRLVNVFVSASEGEALFLQLENSWYWFKP